MLSQKAELKLKAEQRLSPQLIQSIKLMSLPILDLQAQVQLELEKNPALERADTPPEVSLSELSSDAPQPEEADPFSNTSDPGHRPANSRDEDSKRQFLEGAVWREKSLHDRLLDQLHLLMLSDDEIQVADQ